MNAKGKGDNETHFTCKIGEILCEDHNTNNIQHNVAMSGVTPNIPHFSHYTLHYTAGARQPRLHTNIPASV